MKAFAASLLATAALAANKVSWTGTKVTAGDLEATPSGSSSWSGTADKMVVTWKTSVALKTEMAVNDVVQAWWCMPYDGKTDCNIWQWEMTSATKSYIKGRNYRQDKVVDLSTIKPADTNAKDYLDKSWTKESQFAYAQKDGTSTPTADDKETQKAGDYQYASSKVNGKTLTGQFKRTYTTAQTDALEKSGSSVKGLIGVWADDDTKNVKKGTTTTGKSIGIAKAPAAKEVKGEKKTWTGPKISHADNEVTAGGWTTWSKHGTDLHSWLCQTATAKTALKDKNNSMESYLWDTKEKRFWMWQFRLEKIYYYDMTTTLTETKDDKSVKDQVKAKASKTNSKIYYTKGSSGWAIDSNTNFAVANTSLDTTETKPDASNKKFTGCIKTDSTVSGKVAASTKEYTQGVWYSLKDEKDGKRKESKVKVVVAAEGASKSGASALLTTLGAFAAGVAALAF